jgi:hypothetical protein
MMPHGAIDILILVANNDTRLPDQVSVMECGNNFLPQARMQLWFVLRVATSASVSVRWPSGKVSVHAVGNGALETLTEPRRAFASLRAARWPQCAADDTPEEPIRSA